MTRVAMMGLLLAACSKPPSPVTLGHATTVGQRYHVHYARQSEGNTRVLDGTATVTALTPGGAKLAVVVDITSGGASIAKGATFAGTVDYSDSGPFAEAVPTGASKALGDPPSFYDMAVQAILGAACGGPAGMHEVGDHWQMRPEIHWSLLGVEADTASYQVVDDTPDSGRVENMRVSVSDQLVRRCSEEGQPQGTEHFPQQLDIAVTRL